jgi:hypothetical protein
MRSGVSCKPRVSRAMPPDLRSVVPSASADPWSEGAVSIQETRRLLGGVARSEVYRLLGSGQLVSSKVGRRRVIARQSIVEFLARGTR